MICQRWYFRRKGGFGGDDWDAYEEKRERKERLAEEKRNQKERIES
jgi:hypothetical protein